jgi:hypothetical protein
LCPATLPQRMVPIFVPRRPDPGMGGRGGKRRGWGCPRVVERTRGWSGGWGSFDLRRGCAAIGEAHDAGVDEDFSEVIECGAEAGADIALAAVDEESGFGFGIFLEDDAADEDAVEGRKTVEAFLNIKDEDDAIFKSFDDPVRGPAAGEWFGEDGGAAANQHGREEIAAQEPFGAVAVEGKARGRCGRLDGR